MKTIRSIVTTVSLLALTLLPARANLLGNGDFNTGDFTGWWTWAADGTQSTAISTTAPYDATAYALMTSGSSTWRDALGQAGVVIGPNTQYALSFVYNTAAAPSFAVSINYYDSGNNYLNYEWVPTVLSTSGAWSTYSGNFTTPANTASLNLEFDLYSPGAVQLDNVSLTPVTVPEPASMVLWGGAGLIIFVLRRRL
ncbi:MAG TPA: carbohydrate binding domain-containing protein [Candidatus Acidoferrum sp.]|nr:carbohydrate binding domain-containing protein [Candidatus Acidoferrum sp.]